MAEIQFPDPALTHNLAIRISVNEGVGSATVGFHADGYPELPFASFDPSDFSGPEQAANQAVVAAMVTKAKAKQEAMAAAAGNTITWTAP